MSACDNRGRPRLAAPLRRAASGMHRGHAAPAAIAFTPAPSAAADAPGSRPRRAHPALAHACAASGAAADAAALDIHQVLGLEPVSACADVRAIAAVLGAAPVLIDSRCTAATSPARVRDATSPPNELANGSRRSVRDLGAGPVGAISESRSRADVAHGLPVGRDAQSQRCSRRSANALNLRRHWQDRRSSLQSAVASTFAAMACRLRIEALRPRCDGAVQQRCSVTNRATHRDAAPCHHILNTPNCGRSGIGAFSDAAKARPSTSRVCAGSMMPSSHSRAVAC